VGERGERGERVPPARDSVPPSVRERVPRDRDSVPPSVREGVRDGGFERGPASSPRISTLPAAPGNLGLAYGDAVSMAAAAQLLDRLAAAADDPSFLVGWLESQTLGRARIDPPLGVRLLRAYRETGRIDRARDLAASLPPTPSAWNPLDVARLAIERAIVASIDGRSDHAEAELRQASRALGLAPRGTGLREQLDLHLTTAQLELEVNHVPQAVAALRLAEHIAERLEDGAWRIPVAMMLGHLAMRLADPRTAAKHYATALARAPTHGIASMTAQGNMAIALGSIGRFDEARGHAYQATAIAQDIGAGWRHADGFDVLAMVEIASDRPLAALHAVDDALGALGALEQPTLRYQLAEHRTWALAMLGRVQGAKQWLAKADKLRGELAAVDVIDEQDLVATRARTLEACGQMREAIDAAAPYLERLPEAFVTGSLNLVVGRAALALGDDEMARTAVERAALSGDLHGWVFPDRAASARLWALALRSGDSRVVRFAEKMTALANGVAASIPPPSTRAPQSVRSPSIPPPPPSMRGEYFESGSDDPIAFEDFLYVTTPDGVSRVPRAELARATEGARVVVDTLTHALKVDDREVSLERRRALEPLVVQLLRRAREGLSADEVLRAAGGPGPESADAEHRVRVLISRVRDLLGDAASIERVRDAGEYGKTRYRLSAGVRFALVEPLFPG
jgi:tetratricopeptide (TPR) repeat protein